MSTLPLKLSDNLYSRLAAAARRRGQRRSAVVREALIAYLDAAGEATGGSCLEMVADLAGCVKGPRDLSANEEHLRGYGK